MSRLDGLGAAWSALALLALGVLAVPLLAVWLMLPLVPAVAMLAQLLGVF
ncbi:hypothetical protein ACFOE1_07555 [Agromyces mediolanus]|uniref:Uncharacterized protein n=1 Tax=Agromyces mediolanus TaxID=41986 RepID=A0A918CED9_AGRME|nr:hypothetical protein [Agromyces mediolanus]GGR16968.1 hypothetical protein GCM10010196_07150 [Agromyces mediolanus]GLJ71673.1 hypothetical protein GCM10017583_09290 [Agromyces mediolanus]